jgi:hypothetical protein
MIRPLVEKKSEDTAQTIGNSSWRGARAWNSRMNRGRVTIDWRFTRRKARLKFGHKRNQIMRSRYRLCLCIWPKFLRRAD